MAYFYSPSKKGFRGFFSKEILRMFPNLSWLSSRNNDRSLKLFLFAENVSSLCKTGNACREEKRLSSMKRVDRLVKGEKSAPSLI